MNIAICEDNLSIANQLDDIVSNLGNTTSVFSDGKYLIDYFKKNENHFNVVLMDIEMPILSGIETAKQIREIDSDILIIFITDYKEYVYDVFEVLPFQFLAKPIDQELLVKTLDRAKEHLASISQIHEFTIAGESFYIPYREILYFESAGRKIMLRGKSRDYEYYGKITTLASKLNANIFVRTHYSFIVNMEYIHSIKSNSLQLIGGISIPISRRYTTYVKNAHLKILEKRIYNG